LVISVFNNKIAKNDEIIEKSSLSLGEIFFVISSNNPPINTGKDATTMYIYSRLCSFKEFNINNNEKAIKIESPPTRGTVPTWNF